MARTLAQSSPCGDALHLKASGKASEVGFRPVNETLESLLLAAMRRRYYDGSHPIPRIESVGVKYRRFHTGYAALNVLYSSVAVRAHLAPALRTAVVFHARNIITH